MDTNWIEYKCKSGQTLFIYNKVTGEHKWPTYESSRDCVMIGQPVVYKEVCTIGTQTDDNGCNNGCTSIYINTDHVINSTETSPLQEPVVLEVARDDIDIEPGLDNGLDDGGREDRSRDMEETDPMLRILEDDNSFDSDSSEATNYSDTIVNNIDNVLQEGDENDITHLQKLGNDSNNEANNNSVDTIDRDLNVDSFLQEGDRNRILPSGEKNLHVHLKNTSKRKSGVNSHLVTNAREKECSYCRKKFASKWNLTCHLRTHTGEKPFECSYCKKKFTCKQNMITHSRTHTGEKPFECSYCKKKFTRKQHMISHSRTHTGEKPFECSYCKKKFTRKNEMTTHLRIHTGEQPFECSYCKKKFNHKQHMINHSRTHTGEKPFECSYCKKKFTRKQDMMSHSRTHT